MHLPLYGDEFRRTGAFFSSLKVTPSPVPDMFTNISPGGFWVNNKEWVEYVGGRSPGFTAPTIGAKWTILCLHYTGAAMLIEGDASSDPEMPPLERKAFPLAAIYLQAGDVKITGDKIFDVRNLWGSTSYSHVDIEDTNHPESHPIEAIEGLREELDNRSNDSALDNLLDNKADINGTPNGVFVLNKDHVGTPTSNIGFEIERGIENNAVFRYNEQLNVWEYSNDGLVFVQLTNEGPSVILPVASSTVLGGIKVGERLNMNPGTEELSATLQSSNDFTNFYKSKLDSIENDATADMDPSQIKLAYEVNADTNAFTDGEKLKLLNIEDGATAGSMTPVDIKTAYESNIDTNVFTDLERIKLASIENDATGDLSDAEIKVAYENNIDTNEFTDAEKSKLAGIDDEANNYTHPPTHAASTIVENVYRRFVSDEEKVEWNNKANANDLWTKAELVATGGSFDRVDWTHIQNIPAFGSADWLSPVANIAARDAIPSPQSGQCVLVQDDGDGKAAQYAYNGTQWSKIADIDWSPMTDAQVKTAYEANLDTNVFSDAEKTKLSGVAVGANNYSLSIATDSVLGGIKVGVGLQADVDGILSIALDDTGHGDRGGGNLHDLVTGSTAGFMSVVDKAKLDDIEANANNYVLPVSTINDLGGVKIGSSLSMDVDSRMNVIKADGTGLLGVVGVSTGSNISIDAGSQISIEEGSPSVKGVLQVGDNISVTDGEISVPHAQGSNLGLVIAGNNLNLNDTTGEISVSIATDSVPGISKVGDGLIIDGGDSLSVDWTEMPFNDTVHGVRGGDTLHSTATTITSGFMSVSDKLKLDGIETDATADMTSLEIKTAYESNANTNVFDDAASTKLGAIESNATADMDSTEIKTAYESNADTNVLTDTLLTKLNGIEDNAIAYVHPSSHDAVIVNHPITSILIVDNNRVDSYTEDGSLSRPFKTLVNAITNGVTVGGVTLFKVAPGTYNEDIVISGGMHFVCSSPEKNSVCTITGTVNFNDSGVSSFCGIDIVDDGVTNPVVMFYGSSLQTLNLINCEVVSGGLQPALHMNNTYEGKSLVVAEDTNFRNTGSGKSVIVDWGKLNQWKTQNISVSNTTSIQINNSSELESYLGYFGGQLNFAGISTGMLIHPIIDAGSDDCILFDGTTLDLTVPFSLGTGDLIDPVSTGTIVNQTVAEASKIDYTPTTSGDWTGSPTEVLSALDELAARPSGGVSWNYAATADSLPPSPVTGEMWFIGSLASRAGISIPVWYDGVDWVDGVGTFVDLGAGG